VSDTGDNPDYVSVREVMTPAPFEIDGLATVREALDVMRSERVSSVVVSKRHTGDEFGLVVVHDIAEHIVVRDQSPDRTNVYEVMSKPVVTLDADMDIKYAVRLLHRFGISRALVLESGDLIGIVTLRDLVLRHIPGDDVPS
jgi:CBS domain-containing protein